MVVEVYVHKVYFSTTLCDSEKSVNEVCDEDFVVDRESAISQKIGVYTTLSITCCTRNKENSKNNVPSDT